MTLTQDDVVDAAVRLLGEAGLEGLTLRRLARDLGVSAPTLYWHVTDKRTLLDHVATRLVADQWAHTAPAPGQSWADWLRERSLALYRALIAHRDAALVVAGNRPTADTLPAVETTLAALVDAGFEPLDAFHSLMSVGHYVIGSAVEYHAEAARPSGSVPTPDPQERPLLAAVGRALVAEGAGAGHDAAFLHGLDLLIDGMRGRLAQGESPTERAAVSATWSK
jgi:TetR/AcrR family tetracycline transcriptional repressor